MEDCPILLFDYEPTAEINVRVADAVGVYPIRTLHVQLGEDEEHSSVKSSRLITPHQNTFHAIPYC